MGPFLPLPVMRCFLLLLLSLAVASPALAQRAVSGDAQTVTTVAEVIANAPDDSYVTLRGRIVRALGGEDFLFADDTGEIRIEIDDDIMNPRRIRRGMRLEIYGEVERERDGRVEIEVKRLRVL